MTSSSQRGARLALAFKAAIAASAAWFLAPYVPFADSEYSYYAPLGVLVSMYPTLAGSARIGVQSLVGVGLGILLGLGALALVSAGAPGIVAVAIVIGIGILLGGLPALGAGGDGVAMAALFVLLLGGPDADGFSLSYLLTMAFGVVVGVLVNFLVFPPLYLRRASERLSELRDAVRDSLHSVADSMTDEAIDPDAVAGATRGLPQMLDAVADSVREAEESSRGNPRGRRRRDDKELNTRRMAALGRTTRITRELADVLAHAADEESRLDPHVRRALADAVRAAGDLVAAPVGDEGAEDRLTSAAEALDTAMSTLREERPMDAAGYAHAHAYAAAVCVRRIIDASREFVAADR